MTKRSVLEDPRSEPEAGIFVTTKSPEEAPGRSERVETGSVDGVTAWIDREPPSPARLVLRLSETAGFDTPSDAGGFIRMNGLRLSFDTSPRKGL